MPMSSIPTAQPLLAQEQLTPLVPLNAGGQPIDLPLAAVDAFPHSDLACWARDAGAPRDDAGRIFIKRNPEGVATLTDYMRGGQELSTLDAERLATLAAESKALHMGGALDDTIEWEQLRRKVGNLTVDDIVQGPDDPERLRAWLRYQDLSAARGESTDTVHGATLGYAFAQVIHDHYTPLLQADSKHHRALYFLSNCKAVKENARIEHARRFYSVAPHDPLAQVNLVNLALWCSEAPRGFSARDGDKAAALLAQLLRDLPGTNPHETSDRYAFAQRLQSTSLAAIEFALSAPSNSDEALEVGGMLRRLQRQHWASRPPTRSGPACKISMLTPQERAQHQAREAFDKEAELLAAALRNLSAGVPLLVAERVLQLSEAARAEAPGYWWQMRLLCRSQLLSWRAKLRSGDGRDGLRDADVDALQAGYEELWTAYAQRSDSALLELLAAVSTFYAGSADPEVRTMLAAQAARIKAAATLHGPNDAAAQRALKDLAGEPIA